MNATSKFERNALTRAVMKNHAAVARLLLERGADAQAANAFGQTPLLLAAFRHNLEIVQLLSEFGARVGIVEAALLGQTDIAQNFLESGTPVDARNARGMTALMGALRRNDLALAARLLDAGADIEARDKDGETPLFYAVMHETVEAATFLLDRGADVNAQNERGNSALHSAVVARRLPLMRMLLSRGANPDAGGGLVGPSQLFCAVFMPESDPAVVALLLEHGADVHARNSSEETPLLAALDNAPAEIIRLLLAHGADVQASAGHLRPSALHKAVQKGNLEIVRLLLDAGADPNADDALLTAHHNGHAAIADLLQERGATAQPSALAGLEAVLQSPVAVGDFVGRMRDMMKKERQARRAAPQPPEKTDE